MVWRIHFTADDLARIQVSPTLGPLAETVMAVAMLRCRRCRAPWQRMARPGPGQDHAADEAADGADPARHQGVDLCTLTGEAPTIERGVQALLAVPREHLLVEMGYADRHSRLPPPRGRWPSPGRGPT